MKAEPGSGLAAYRRVVIDTNVLISAALSPTGASAQLVDYLLQHSQLVFSEQTFDELATRLWKPKFDRYLSLERRQLLLHDFDAIALRIHITEDIASVAYSRDASDDAFIHAALAARAQRLVSGDNDLLSVDLSSWAIAKQRLSIVTPRQALDELDLDSLKFS